MPRDVEMVDAEREVDRIVILERGGEIGQVQRDKNDRQPYRRRDRRLTGRECVRGALEARVVCACVRAHAGRRNSPSFRLPRR